jgi:8-oxo-dGTP diphosphatase
VVSVAYLAMGAGLPDPRGGSDALSAQFEPVSEYLSRRAGPLALAFDHKAILAAGVERARAKLEYTGLGVAFCPPEFTVGELRAVYEAVWDVTLDPANFHRKVTNASGFLVPTGGRTSRGGGRPAALYRADPLVPLHPPIMRA